MMPAGAQSLDTQVSLPRSGQFQSLKLQRWRWRFKVTGSGWYFFLVTLGVGFAALNTGSNLLYLLLGMLCSFIIVSGILSEIVLSGIACEIAGPQEFWSGGKGLIFLRMRNTKRFFPSLGMHLRMPYVREAPKTVASMLAAGFCPMLWAGEAKVIALSLCSGPRGRYRADHLEISTTFPFHFLRKSWQLRLPNTSELLVFPRPGSLGVAVSKAVDDTATLERFYSKSARARDSETQSHLKDFLPGDNTRQIHWKASAKRRSLVVKELDLPPTPPAVEIYVDYLRCIDLERREVHISEAVALVLKAEQEGSGWRCYVDDLCIGDSDVGLSEVCGALAVLDDHADMLTG